MNPKVDFYFTKEKKWKEGIEQLRLIALDCDLNEELKWGCPCYVNDGNNIVLIHTFKEYFALLFFKGALMKDNDDLLIQQTANVQAARQMRFTSVDEVMSLQPSVKSYIQEATDIDKAGLKVQLKSVDEYGVPEEFQQKLIEMPELEAAFKNLTPGRQRAYLFYFSQPKQSKTRESRIDKSLTMILDGKGLND